jgi:hypothetical protein
VHNKSVEVSKYPVSLLTFQSDALILHRVVEHESVLELCYGMVIQEVGFVHT